MQNLKDLIKLLPFFIVPCAYGEEVMVYDPESGQVVLQQTSGEVEASQEGLYRFIVSGIKLGDLELKENVAGEPLINLAQWVQVFSLPIEVSGLSANGWLYSQEQLFILAANSEGVNIEFNKQTQFFAAEEVLLEGDQLWLPLTRLLNLVKIDSRVTANDYTVLLYPKQLLPAQLKQLRDQRKPAKAIQIEEAQAPRKEVPYQLFFPGPIDFAISADQKFTREKSLQMSAAGAGDFLYMSGNYFARLSYDTNRKDPTLSLRGSLNKSSETPDLLGIGATYYEIGDISPASAMEVNKGGSNIGFRASNRPKNVITNLQTKDFRGTSRPGWDLELYRNGLFLAKTVVAEDGAYELLDQPLVVGNNRFELKFYGTEGQFDEQVEIVTLDPSALNGSGLIYDISTTYQNSRLEDFFDDTPNADASIRVDGHIEKNIARQTALTFDFANYEFSDNTRHSFIQLGARTFVQSALLQAQYLKDLAAGYEAGFKVSFQPIWLRGDSIALSWRQRSRDFAADVSGEDGIKNQSSLSYQGGSRVVLPLNYGLSFQVSDYYDQRQNRSLSTNLGTSFKRISVYNRYSVSETEVNGVRSQSQQGSLSLSTVYQNIRPRFSLDYHVKPVRELRAANLSLAWQAKPSVNTRFDFGYSFETESFVPSAAVSWQHPNFITSFRASHSADLGYALSANIRFSLGYDPLKNELYMEPIPLSQTASVAAKVYQDLNNNQVHDPGEPLIEGAEVQAKQQRRQSLTDENGVTLVKGLRDQRATDIVVDKDSLEDPQLVPATKGESFLPRPGIVKYIEIPVVLSGEVEGSVRFANDYQQSRTPVAGVPIVAINLETGERRVLQSEFDGYFLLNQLTPGFYRIQIPPDYLEKKGLQTRRPFEVEIESHGSLIIGANFTLFPKEIEIAQKEQKGAEFFDVTLQGFVSESNAKEAIIAFRQVFSNLLNSQSLGAKSVTIHQQNGEFFPVVSGFKQQAALNLCATLEAEGIACQVSATPQVSMEVMTATQNESIDRSLPLAPLPVPKLIVTKSTPSQSLTPETQHEYAVQLMSSSSHQEAMAFMREYGLADAMIEPAQVREQLVYRVVMKASSKAQAQQLAQRLQAKTGVQPWVRAL